MPVSDDYRVNGKVLRIFSGSTEAHLPQEVTLTRQQFEDIRSWINLGMDLGYWLDEDNAMDSDPRQQITFALAQRVHSILSGEA